LSMDLPNRILDQIYVLHKQVEYNQTCVNDLLWTTTTCQQRPV